MSTELEKQGYVYFCRAKRSGLIKIGWALDPAARVDSFRCGCPEELELVAAFRGGRDLEAAYHRVWRECRVRGEWFFPSVCLAFNMRLPEFACLPAEGDKQYGDTVARLQAGEQALGQPYLEPSVDSFSDLTWPA
jgi:hypothetical protein